MPAQKSGKLAKPAAKPVAKKPIKAASPAKAKLKVVNTADKPAAKATGARIVILNAEATPMDALADARLSGSISEWLPRICGG